MASRKYRITVVHNLGPFKTMQDVSAVKKAVKNKLPKITFSSPKKLSNGYKFTGTVRYTKSIDAPKNIVEAAVKKLAPKAKIMVSIVR